MKRRKYKFTHKYQSKQGVASTVIGVMSLFVTAGVIAIAYMQSGQADKFIAIPGFLALLFSLMGLYYGFRGLREEDSYRLFPGLGCIVNGLVLTVYAMIYVLGW